MTMEDEEVEAKQAEFEKDIRPALTIALLERSDKSGEMMRALLFGASAGAVAFILQQQAGRALGYHIWPLVLFGLAAVAIFISWDIQKRKAGDKFKALRDCGKATYRQTDGFSNYWIDRSAAAMIAIGVAAETGLRLCEYG